MSEHYFKIKKLGNLSVEAEDMKLEILGLLETRWIDTGYIKKKTVRGKGRFGATG